MSTFAITRASAVAPAGAATPSSRRGAVSSKRPSKIFAADVRGDGKGGMEVSEPVVFYTSADGQSQRGTQAEYLAAKDAGKTYRASTVTGLLPAWAAGAVTDSTVNYSLKQAFAFTAPAGTKFLASGPELMNGRLAMIAMVSALGNEIVTGQSVGQQLAQSPAGVGVTALLVVLGTLSSYCANIEPPAAGPFVNTTELLNGRVAMIGVAILLTLENNNGHALLQFLHAASETSA